MINNTYMFCFHLNVCDSRGSRYTPSLHRPLAILDDVNDSIPHSPRLMERKVDSFRQRIPHLYHQIKVALRVWRRDGCITAIVAPSIRHVTHLNGTEKIGGYLLNTPDKVLFHKIRSRRFLLCTSWGGTA